MTHSTTDTLETLTNELHDFCGKEGLPQESADDLLATNPALTEPQRQWLTDFCVRWDATNQPTTDTRETLTAELRAFCDKEGLPHISAEDLIVDPALTDQQSQWVAEFCGRWDALDQLQEDRNSDDECDTSDDL